MARGKYETRIKRRFPLWLVIVLAILMCMTMGGVSAYLSMSSGASNTLAVETHPVVTVSGTTVTVIDPGYEVYVRVMVVANQTSGSNVVAGNYTCSLTDTTNWFEHGGFWYYKNPVKNTSITPTFTSPDGATVTMYAQAIQAVGTTNTNDNSEGTPAVQDAWDVIVNADRTISAPSSSQ